jgi:2-iminobutanoate/2-iminopropanoate deaminase
MRVLSPTTLGPPAGNYSHGIVAGGFIHVAGTVGIDSNGSVPDSVADQTRQAIDNVEAILAEAGATLADVVSATVYLTDMADYRAFAQAWGDRFGEHRPARATVRADLVHPSLKVEIQAVAVDRSESTS